MLDTLIYSLSRNNSITQSVTVWLDEINGFTTISERERKRERERERERGEHQNMFIRTTDNCEPLQMAITLAKNQICQNFCTEL